MPDWSYHPFFKHVFFALSGENARRFTMLLMQMQARVGVGRKVFQLMSPGFPPKAASATVDGVYLPSRVGMAAGIDVDAQALSVLQYLGFGFLQVGPVGIDPVAREPSTEALRLRDRHCIAHGYQSAAIGAETLARRLQNAPELALPVGATLRGRKLTEAIAALDPATAFFTVPHRELTDESLDDLRLSTKKPLYLRVPSSLGSAEFRRLLDLAVAAGWNGLSIGGADTQLLPGGELDGPVIGKDVYRCLQEARKTLDDGFTLIAGGGVNNPGDGTALLNGGADLIELYAGLVYAGPGLPFRIIRDLLTSARDREGST